MKIFMISFKRQKSLIKIYSIKDNNRKVLPDRNRRESVNKARKGVFYFLNLTIK